MKNKCILICVVVALFVGFTSVYAKITPVVISEVFYDTPLNENSRDGGVHHNGEFIELFNPTTESIDLSGWKISDNTTNYIFPDNTNLQSRTLIVLAYRFPNSGFSLNSLFPSINSIPSPNILYQDRILMMNDGEEIKLYDKTNRLIDKMSYRHRSTFGSRSGYWDICASNGKKIAASESSLVSIQRNNIHYSTSGITSLVSDFNVGRPTPLKLDESIDIPYVDNIYDSDQIDTSLPVGSLQGNASISPTGAATYQLAIECPLGTNGLQPNLSITYNNQGGQGLLGLGWDLAGLSAISRSPKNLYYDGENGKTIAFDNTDCLTLDGQRLILLSNENLTEGAVYGTEFENYTRVTVTKSTFDDIHFVVTTKDGTIMEYGSTLDSRLTSTSIISIGVTVALAWKLNRITDVFGNTMEFLYGSTGKYISQIKYLGASNSYQNIIQFNYYDSPLFGSSKYKVPKRISCTNGFWLKQDKILDNITTYADGSKVKTYSFNYIQSDRDLRLNTLATYNVANKKLTESKINWGTENNTISLVNVDRMTDSNMNNVDNATLYSGDIDGDGLQDKIELCLEPFDKDKPLASGFFRVIIEKNKRTLLSPTFRYRNSLNTNYDNPIIKIVDINLDGKDEIILCQVEDEYPETPEGIKLNGTQKYIQTFNYNDITGNIELFSNSSYLANPEYYAGAYGHLNCDFMISDVNNDSYPDLIMIPSINKNDDAYTDRFQKIQFFLGSNNGLAKKSTLSDGLNYYSTGVLQKVIGDFNADGKIDNLHLTYDEPSKIYYNDNNLDIIVSKSLGGDNLFLRPWSLFGGATPIDLFKYCLSIDSNNDGLTDLLVQANNDKDCKIRNGWYILKNNGGYNVEPTRIDLSNLPKLKYSTDDRHQPFIIDYNGDGYADIILGDEVYSKGKYQYTNWYFYKNANGSFVEDGTQRTTTKLSKMDPINIDINNDGVQDLVFGSGSNYMAFTIVNASSRYRVQSITNGLGQSDKFVYTNVANQNNTDTPEQVMNIHAPITVVTSYEDKNGTITNYEYGVPKIHTRGKGFLGFETITTKTPRLGIKTVSTYEINTAYFGLNLKSQEVFALNSTTRISSSSQINNVIDGNNSVNAIQKGKNNINRFMPYVSYSTSIDDMNGTSQITNNLMFDAYWNVTKQESVMGEATKITETTYVSRNGNSILYLPATIKVTQKRTGTPDIVSQTNYTNYNAAGQVGTVTSYPNTDGQVTTEYFYYPTGNLQKKTVTPKNFAALSTSYGYDDYFRLPTSEVNSLNQTASTTYNYATGDVKTKTDVNGFTTEYKYNDYGKLYLEIQPNGEEITYSTTWDSNYGALYKQTATNKKIINSVSNYYDKYSREIYSEQNGWKGKKLESTKEYNPKGQLAKAFMPHYAEETALYTEYEYNDILGRVTKEKTFDGKQILTTDYTYTPTTTTITPPDANQKKTEVRDKHGLVVERTDAGGTISYTYNATGQPLTITSNGSKTEILYDDYGNQKLLKDPNAGDISFRYMANGLLHTQTNAKGDITEMSYDDLWRLDTKTLTEAVSGKKTETKYTYVPTGNGIGQLDNIELKEQGSLVHKQSFTYNPLHQTETVTDEYDGQTAVFSNTYDELWRPSTSISPSGLQTNNHYNDYGDLDKILSNDITLWEGNEQNSKGQFTQYTLGNGLTTTRSYSDRGEIESIRTYLPNSTSNIQNNIYTYYAKTANLHTRNDLKNGRSEEFEYDELDRLTKAWQNGVLKHNMNYYPNGNINTKSDVGTYRYETPRPHAMSGIDNVGAGVTNEKQFIDYTSFNKVNRIRQGLNENNITKVYDIFYGLDEQRIKTIYDDFSTSGHIKIRYYFGSYEKEIDEFSNITNIDYVYTPTGLTLIIKNGTKYYTHTDLLGSIERITNATGNMVSEYAYTPWGGRILLSGVNITDRGYTGHEHLTPFGDDTNGGFCLINMNGRIYDPVLARFLSPDPYVQAPDFTQSFNRYAYCLNNPFRYTDPSGEFWHIVIGAAIGGVVNLVSQISAGNIRNVWDALGAFGIGAAVGGLSAAGGVWVAGAVKAAGIITGAAIGAASGAVIGGASSFLLNGGNNLLNGNNFLDNWQQSVKSGAFIGAITGGIAGGISGYSEALKQGKNMWWGSKITYGNTKWSFFNAEKPYEVIDYKIKNTGNKATNDCVPTTLGEIDKTIYGQETYDYNTKKVGYINEEGTYMSRRNFMDIMSKEYGASEFTNIKLDDLQSMKQVLKSGDKITLHAKGMFSVDHVDNIRTIKYYSNKVVVNLRVGSYTIKNLSSYNIMYFRVPNAITQSQQQLYRSFLLFK
ncbi:MAG: lamin tail domain-containing protein [Paludibacter sp.]|nr:lamin tail domain-containing protein [Paludibacter sp.]